MTHIQPINPSEIWSPLFIVFRTGDVAQEFLTLPGSELGDPMILASRGWRPKTQVRRFDHLGHGTYIEAISDMEAYTKMKPIKTPI